MSAQPPSCLVLASGSPRRWELVGALGAPFAVRTADVAELLSVEVPAAEQAETLALEKARAVVEGVVGAVVVGADTIVVLDGAPLGKPTDADDARRMLRALRGRAHEVITSVAAVAADGVTAATDSATTLVRMRDYTDAEIETYIAGGDPFDKAGAYAIQHAGFQPVERIEGCYCNVMGLPLWTLRRLLTRVAPSLVTRPPSITFERCGGCPLADPVD